MKMYDSNLLDFYFGAEEGRVAPRDRVLARKADCALKIVLLAKKDASLASLLEFFSSGPPTAAFYPLRMPSCTRQSGLFYFWFFFFPPSVLFSTKFVNMNFKKGCTMWIFLFYRCFCILPLLNALLRFGTSEDDKQYLMLQRCTNVICWEVTTPLAGFWDHLQKIEGPLLPTDHSWHLRDFNFR